LTILRQSIAYDYIGVTIMSLIVSFRGLDADRHLLDAYTGSESIAGISRSLALVAHYAATGIVRHRLPFSEDLGFYIEAIEPGSFNWRYALIGVAAPTIGLGLATNGIYDLGKLVLSRATGQETTQIDTQVSRIDAVRGGDIDALVEAVGPALKRGHSGIGDTANQIVIVNGDNNNTLITFDAASKDYISQTVDGTIDYQDVSISALNVNDRTGRAYFVDLHRTVPFLIAREAEPKTMSVLSRGLNNYANKNGATINIRFKRLNAIDGRLKRIIIYDATDVSGEE
jgi:hypothetical protein